MSNQADALQASTKGGAFDVPGDLARAWFALPNRTVDATPMSCKPWWNGEALTRRDPDKWIIDFYGMSAEEACCTKRRSTMFCSTSNRCATTTRTRDQRNYWLFKRSGADCEVQAGHLSQVIATPETPTHAVFGWIRTWRRGRQELGGHRPSGPTRTFGLVSGRPHLLWVATLGGRYGDHPTARRYNSSRTFDPSPSPPV